MHLSSLIQSISTSQIAHAKDNATNLTKRMTCSNAAYSDSFLSGELAGEAFISGESFISGDAI